MPKSKPAYPSEALDKMLLRLPVGMRAAIAKSAEDGGVSMNSEVVRRLGESFQLQMESAAKELELRQLRADFGLLMEQNVRYARMFEEQQVLTRTLVTWLDGKAGAVDAKALREDILNICAMLDERDERFRAAAKQLQVASHTEKVETLWPPAAESKQVPARLPAADQRRKKK